MKNIHIKVLVYGIYAVLCHVCGVFLYYSVNKALLPREPLIRICAEMIEYSIMSAIITAVGGMLMFITIKERTQ
ncbi:MAG: hypothetical protein J6U86_03080 [Clostridia bacterium]|nr:hypothetical protein [Clostridia bacterium]